MKLSDLTSTAVGQQARLAIDGKPYTGPIRHLRSHQFPGNDPRLAGKGTPPPDQWTIDIQIGNVAFEGISPDTEIELLAPLPDFIATDDRHFPEELFERLAGGSLRELSHGSMGAMGVKLDDGRSGTYELSTNPQRRGWKITRA